MNYQQTIEYLFTRLPMFQRIGAAAYKADLKNTITLCALLNNPEKNFPAVHIAGTNGKGSVSNIVASILQEAGYRTGLFTSPHLKDFRERIRVNGAMIPEQFIIDFVEKHKPDFESLGVSFFEYTFTMCMQYFSEEKIDIAVVETGMGGRLDSSNVVHPVVCAITNIGFDHTAFLGNTIKAIAAEKAGIIKPGIPVVIGEMQEDTMEVFIEKSQEEEAPLSFADNHYTARFKSDQLLDIQEDGKIFLHDIHFPLLGHYQEKNVPTALEIIAVLKQGGFKIIKKHILAGLEKVTENTEFIGRWQIINKQPLIIFDTAHNESGLNEVFRQIKTLSYRQLHIVLGMANDKDISAMLALMPQQAVFYFCKADIPRGLDAKILQQEAGKFGLQGKTYASVKEAFKTARQTALPDDLIFVGGSTFTVAEVV